MKKTFFAFLILSTLLCACSKEDDEVTPQDTTEKESEEESEKENSEEEEEDNNSNRPSSLDEYNQVVEGLKDYYSADYFEIGMAITPWATQDSMDVKLMKRHASCFTAENAMKWDALERNEGNFNFTNADKIVDFASENGKKVRGHTLVWHSQCPDWVFEENGAVASKEKVLERMRNHISTVMSHYKGKVYVWDVVNEAISDGSGHYRDSKWYQICGEDFIIEAFKAAREADPNAKLFYNDYGTVSAGKRGRIFQTLKMLKEKDLIDGMGMQSHWSTAYPLEEDLRETIELYASLGLEIHITELDVSVYTLDGAQEVAYTSRIAGKLATAYKTYFNILREYKEFITNVTFWGITDEGSWLNNFPVKNRTNYPLLFDSEHSPKEAYYEIIDFN